jgi:hypothetical protein
VKQQSHRQMNRAVFNLILAISLIVMTGAMGWIRPQPVSAQNAQTVSYDTPVEGQIDDSAIEGIWTLNVPGKDTISVVVERTGGTLVPSLALRDGNNQPVRDVGGGGATSADADSTRARATIRSATLPAAGTYNIVVGRYRGKDGKTTGNYKLTVTLLGAGEGNPGLNPTPGTVEYDKPVTGELTNAKWKDIWTFDAMGRDVVSVAVTRTDGTLRPRLDLLDSNLKSIRTQGGYPPGSDDGLSDNIGRTKLPGPGQYFVHVYRDGSQQGRTTGKYSLTVKLEGTGPEQLLLFKPIGAVSPDKPVTGELTNAQWVNVWTLDTQSRDRLLLSVIRTEGSLRPVVSLFGGNNQEIKRGENDSTGAGSQLEVTLPGPGRYQIRVSRSSDESGTTTGKYQLTLSILGTGDENAIFKTSAGQVTIDEPVRGSLDNVKWKDSWTINVQGNSPLTIVARRTNGTLAPRISVLGASQQEIRSADADETFTTATLSGLTLPGTGQYTIIVSRSGGRDGGTSGGYELTVTAAQK